jgi:hypothetical protein
MALIGGTGGLVMIGLGVSIAATGRKTEWEAPGCAERSFYRGGRLDRMVILMLLSPCLLTSFMPSR